MAKWKEYFYIMLCGGAGYSLLEILWRGYTHWTMTLTGGAALLCIYAMLDFFSQGTLLQKCLLGSVMITTLELMVGTLVNLYFEWHVWDYSTMPWNFFGQICLQYTAYWFLLCLLLVPLCPLLRRFLCGRRREFSNASE